MGKITNGIEISKQCWQALRQNKQLVAFPIISGIGMLITTALFFTPAAVVLKPMLADNDVQVPASQWVMAGILLFLYYLVAAFVIIFSNTALIGATLKMIRGEDATVMDGYRIALSKFKKIFVYSLVSATVGVFARSVSQSGRNADNIFITILAAIVGATIAAAWNLIMFFAIPVIVMEELGFKDSLKRSLELFKQTWGEGFTGSMAILGVTAIGYVAVVLVGGAIFVAGGTMNILPIIILGIVIIIGGMLMISLFNGAVNGIFQASLYNFAVTGESGPFIETETARNAF